MSRQPAEIIGEIANAHQGDPAQALSLARAVIAAGADAVKFQVYFADELLVRSHPRHEHFEKQAFSAEVWQRLLGDVVQTGARVYCDVFGLKALGVAAKVGVHGFKVHSSDLGNLPLLEAIAAMRKRTLVSAGGSTVRELMTAVRVLTSSPVRPVLLHGFQSYPTAIEDSSLARIGWLHDLFGDRCDVGYMDHVDGGDPFAFTAPLLALAMGATVLEKHVTLDRAARGVDYYSSLNPDEFGRFVKAVRQSERALGDGPEQFAPSEREYRQQVKKHWVTARILPAGHMIVADDLAMKRVANHEAEPVELAKLTGRLLLVACDAEHAMSRADVAHRVWALVVARMRSSRLPGKALVDVGGMPALQHLLERLKQARTVDRIVLCTTTEREDDPLARLADCIGIPCHRGPSEDVLGRMLGAVKGQGVDIALRVTGDDILVDPDYVDRAVRYHLQHNVEYSDLKALPSGTEVEVFDVSLLHDIWTTAHDSGGTEYLTTYVRDHRDQFRTASVPVEPRHAHDWRLTLDTREDYEVIRAILEEMKARGKQLDYRLDDIVEVLSGRPDLLRINAGVRQRQTPPDVTTTLDWRRLA